VGLVIASGIVPNLNVSRAWSLQIIERITLALEVIEGKFEKHSRTIHLNGKLEPVLTSLH